MHRAVGDLADLRVAHVLPVDLVEAHVVDRVGAVAREVDDGGVVAFAVVVASRDGHEIQKLRRIGLALDVLPVQGAQDHVFRAHLFRVVIHPGDELGLVIACRIQANVGHAVLARVFLVRVEGHGANVGVADVVVVFVAGSEVRGVVRDFLALEGLAVAVFDARVGKGRVGQGVALVFALVVVVGIEDDVLLGALGALHKGQLVHGI